MKYARDRFEFVEFVDDDTLKLYDTELHTVVEVSHEVTLDINLTELYARFLYGGEYYYFDDYYNWFDDFRGVL